MKKTGLIIVTGIVVAFVCFLSFNMKSNAEPRTMYQIYLADKSLGYVESKEELENYIDKQQDSIKKKYKVDKVYPPKDLHIKKDITYNKKATSPKDIYKKIKDLKPFTIQSYQAMIKNKEDSKKNKTINFLDEEVFKKSIDTTVTTFVGKNNYKSFINETQVEIKEFGSLIENVYLKEDITIKKALVSTEEEIFTNEENLTKFLLFGTTEKQGTYTVQDGDTIEKVAFNNKLNVDEFLIANPQFDSANNLLYPGQEVVIGLINPQVSVVLEEHKVEEKEKPFQTEIKYDQEMLKGETKDVQAGENGREKVTEKIQYVNGEIYTVVTVATEELKPAVNRVYIEGGKVVASVGDRNNWLWPTKTPYTISTGYGYRWGKFHTALDITGTGLGSPIYAANNGVIVFSGWDSYGGGNMITINHNNGVYTTYAHLQKNYVKTGDIVPRGHVIGSMGSTGFSTGPHLHYEITTGGQPYKGGVHIDPYSLYGR